MANTNDAFNRANSGNLADLVGSLGWKGTGILILVIIIGFIIVITLLQVERERLFNKGSCFSTNGG
jgi:hypothetical protein